MNPVSRKEDMSPRGQLKLMEDDCGDIIVSVHGDAGDGVIEDWASVEFCTVGMGGGQSPHTRKALIELAKAMERDNEETPSRAGDL